MLKSGNLLFAVVLALLACTPRITDSGGASETVAVVMEGSRISGTISLQNGSPDQAGNAMYFVGVYDTSYLPLFFTSDSNFRDTVTAAPTIQFSFDNLQPGKYNLYVLNKSSLKALFMRSLTIPTPSQTTRDGVLKSPGSLTGTLYHAPDSGNADTLTTPYANVFIIGSPFLCLSNQNGRFALFDIPEGSYMLSAYILQDSTVDSTNIITQIYTDDHTYELNVGEEKTHIDIYTDQ